MKDFNFDNVTNRIVDRTSNDLISGNNIPLRPHYDEQASDQGLISADLNNKQLSKTKGDRNLRQNIVTMFKSLLPTKSNKELQIGQPTKFVKVDGFNIENDQDSFLGSHSIIGARNDTHVNQSTRNKMTTNFDEIDPNDLGSYDRILDLLETKYEDNDQWEENMIVKLEKRIGDRKNKDIEAVHRFERVEDVFEEDLDDSSDEGYSTLNDNDYDLEMYFFDHEQEPMSRRGGFIGSWDEDIKPDDYATAIELEKGGSKESGTARKYKGKAKLEAARPVIPLKSVGFLDDSLQKYRVMHVLGMSKAEVADRMKKDGIKPSCLFGDSYSPSDRWVKKFNQRTKAYYYQNEKTGDVLDEDMLDDDIVDEVKELITQV